MSEADNFKVEKSFFKLSLLYLFVLFGAIGVDAVLGWGGLV